MVQSRNIIHQFADIRSAKTGRVIQSALSPKHHLPWLMAVTFEEFKKTPTVITMNSG